MILIKGTQLFVLKKITVYSILKTDTNFTGFKAMSMKKAVIFIFFSGLLMLISACTQKKFNLLQPINANAVPKTPGYYNPDNEPDGLPKNQQPVVENQFAWKSSN